jgi:hypothetical protein
MSPGEQREFQRSIRAGLRATAEAKYRAELDEIDVEAKRQRVDCSGSTSDLAAKLDAAIAAETLAVAAAKADIKRAREARDAAKARRAADKAARVARVGQKREACAIEAKAIKARKRALKAHKKELRQIERSTERRAKPLSSAGERRSERRGAVEGDIPEHLVPLWRKVGRSFRLGPRQEGRMSLADGFVQWAEENPGQAVAAQEQAAEASLRKLQREDRRGRGGRRARREPDTSFDSASF